MVGPRLVADWGRNTPAPSASEPAISTSPEPTLWIGTDTCALGPYRADLVETYWRWEQDPGLLVGYGRQAPESLEARTEGMAHQLRGENIRFTVYDLSEGTPTPVGVTTLLPDHSVRTAEYVVMLAPEARGRGLGTQATRLTLDYAFHITNLRMVWLKVLAPTRRASTRTRGQASRSWAVCGSPGTGSVRSATRSSWTLSPPSFPDPPSSRRCCLWVDQRSSWASCTQSGSRRRAATELFTTREADISTVSASTS